MDNFRKNVGFTIVELLVVIVVIAILAFIAVVAYSGVQLRAKNTQLLASFDAYDKALAMYYQTTGTYPEMNDIGPNSSMVACVGSGYQSSWFRIGHVSHAKRYCRREAKRTIWQCDGSVLAGSACSEWGNNIQWSKPWWWYCLRKRDALQWREKLCDGVRRETAVLREG